MDIVLQIGAPRCAHATFHAYMAGNAGLLRRHGIGFWGPERLRALTAGDRAPGRVALALEKAERSGIRHLVASAPSVCGPARDSLRTSRICPGAGGRLDRVMTLFAGRVTRVALVIRAPDRFWASALSVAVGLGRTLPESRDLARLTAAGGWRDTVERAARAAAGAELVVLAHEEIAALPDRRLWHLTGGALLPPLTQAREWLNPAPDMAALRRTTGTEEPAGEGRWMPFGPRARALLRDRYSEDLLWLAAGANGLARLATERGNRPGEAGAHPPPGETRGRRDDIEEGRMVGHR